jgi:clan AA aspartic protease (TIGR02281 family)
MSAHAQAQPQIRCLTTGDLVTGVLKLAQDTHPNGTLMEAYVLRLPTPRCAVDKFTPAGANPMFGVQEIHLVPPQDKQGPPLSSLVGQTITVRVEDFYRSSTAWHFGNAVSDKYAVVPASNAPSRLADRPAGLIEVPMVRSGGTYGVPVQINGAITLDFVLDSGASDVSIPSDVFRTLVRTGTITKEDTIGSETYTLADGSRKKATTFRIRSLKVGPKGLEDVKGSVAEDDSPLLLGMSFLSRFRSWSVDNERHVLVLK